MRQFYEQQSGQSYSVRGQVAGWYTADRNAAYYGANATPETIRELVKEALIQVAGDPAIDLAQFDQEDRYDLNGNGNRNEPDGLIDHLMIFHSSVGEEAGGGDLGEDAIWAHRWNLGAPTPSPAPAARARTFGGQFAAYDYTIQPIDAAAGVCAHEYGHDLGLPDEYDTKYTGKGNRWRPGPSCPPAPGPGSSAAPSRPGSPPGPRSSCRPPSAATGCTAATCSSPISAPAATSTLDQANDKGRNDDVVRINLPAKQIPLNPPYAGQGYQYHGGRATTSTTCMSLKLDLSGKQERQPRLQGLVSD